jgi:hypothetical protein
VVTGPVTGGWAIDTIADVFRGFIRPADARALIAAAANSNVGG